MISEQEYALLFCLPKYSISLSKPAFRMCRIVWNRVMEMSPSICLRGDVLGFAPAHGSSAHRYHGPRRPSLQACVKTQQACSLGQKRERNSNCKENEVGIKRVMNLPVMGVFR